MESSEPSSLLKRAPLSWPLSEVALRLISQELSSGFDEVKAMNANLHADLSELNREMDSIQLPLFKAVIGSL